MRYIAILASTFALLLAIAWLIAAPAYDSAVACAAAVVALLSTFFIKKEKKPVGQSQQVSKSTIAIQAGRDVKIHDNRKD